MTYPVIVLIVAVLATVAMLTFVVPTFAQMFVDMGGSRHYQPKLSWIFPVFSNFFFS